MGFSDAEADILWQAQGRLHRWAERECNGDIERDADDKPGRYGGRDGKRFFRIPDLEAGALKRVAAVMERHPDYVAYHQTDPRGCALYIVKKSDVPEGKDIGGYYSRGLAVCA